jgi:hypothetical protein
MKGVPFNFSTYVYHHNMSLKAQHDENLLLNIFVLMVLAWSANVNVGILPSHPRDRYRFKSQNVAIIYINSLTQHS